MPTLELTTTKAQPVAVKEELSLSATTPTKMRESQTQLIEWCKRKILSEKFDVDELKASFESAKEKKWKTSTLERHWKLAVKRVEYYRKILAALEAGFVIVPNFPVTLFAIRTEKGKPLAYATTSWSSTHAQKSQNLPAGKGDYKNPLPLIVQTEIGSPDKPQKMYEAESWEPLDFPINMSKPHIMEATDRAMALKIFDELGVLPSPYRKIDPLIVGRIRDPRASKYDRDGVITFIVCWHLDTRML